MAYQTPIPIREVLDRIYRREYVLPAIQREFVWSADQVCSLFDSLMLKYPIGAFLFWEVSEEKSLEFDFYEFMAKYHERTHRRCKRLDLPQAKSVIAILDGQQRLTALNIGLNGTYAEKLPRKWATSPDAYPEKRLYLELCGEAPDDERGLRYGFEFLTDAEAQRRHSEAAHWFRVSDARDMRRDAPTLLAYVKDIGIASDLEIAATRTLDTLLRVVNEDPVVSYHLEREQEIDRVLNIFIRVNSGGTQLSHSDLLLSIATAEWPQRDAREAVNSLVDELNATHQGFAFTKDIVLKAGLILIEASDIRFRVANFTRENMARLDEDWDRVASALRLAAKLLGRFGFSERTLTAHSVLIPVAYYLYGRKATDSYLEASGEADDRRAVRRWVTRSLVAPGIWGSGLDTLLAALRNVIREHGTARFPLESIEQEMARRGKSLRVDVETIQDLVDTQYGNKRAFPLLALLYPGIDVRYDFHVDHVFPHSLFKRPKLRAYAKEHDLTWTDEQIDAMVDGANRMGNLQLLEGQVNESKQATLPLKWADHTFRDVDQLPNYLQRHDLEHLPANLEGFWDFYVARRDRMFNRLSALIGPSPSETAQDEGAVQLGSDG
jgi:Protein of unknown function DUF262